MGNAPDVEVRPRRADSGLVSACCLARKGNFRHGPPVPVDIAQDWKSLAREERYGKKVTWCPGRMLETRYELIESGDEWTEARKSQDVDLSALPEVGAVRNMSFSPAPATARQRVAERRKGRNRGEAEKSESSTAPSNLEVTKLEHEMGEAFEAPKAEDFSQAAPE
eukprot:s1287_g2.t1